jgi:hypothetical protein
VTVSGNRAKQGDSRIEVIRDALREFAYRPGQPMFSRYEAATAALAALEAREKALDDLLTAWDMSADVLGPEWVALAEKMEKLR